MVGPIIGISRFIAIRRNASTLGTEIMPLSRISSAVVVADAQEPQCQEALAQAERFFLSMGIPVKLLFVRKENLDLLGRLKRKIRFDGGKQTSEDLLICLTSNPSFAFRYEAVCSKSRFKIGRIQLRKDLFDVVFGTPEGKVSGQAEVFEEIAEFLKKIK